LKTQGAKSSIISFGRFGHPVVPENRLLVTCLSQIRNKWSLTFECYENEIVELQKLRNGLER
jgi:hypothetical protein